MALASDSEELSYSIERLYDAVLDPSKWNEALEATTRFIGGEAANLFWQDLATNEAAVFHSWNEDAYYGQLYTEKYASLNPYFPALAFVEVGKVVSGGDLIPHDEFRQTRFYMEWVKPQNYIDVLGANLERTLTSTAFFSVQRHERQGVVDERARERCNLILPHIRRAVSIGKVIEKGRAHERLLENALHLISSAALMVDATGRIVFANAKSEEYLAHAAIIRADQGILHAIDRDAERALKDAFAAAARGDSVLGVKGIEVVLANGGKSRFVAHVLCLASDARRDVTTSGAVAALFVNEVRLALQSPLEEIAARFLLTPSELRVLAAVWEESGVQQIAERLGISAATVKTHLNHIFSKTGLRRQADLVRLASRDATLDYQPKG
ncbi:helix-turn-helix transcriptional regulator [Hyphomicrobium sp.]|uniref:helix-turn-helix transcriptional regulator n=1 Tax=Hyphomicrobium sp. TaxID=82 RepID=UPI000F9B092F|nr:helix-turn-helix transcriptional regulator [Hyphomicrobium sp.]RUP00346.1 MAG: LuxR family transcriptional regulator [Hyphomicrobium sp.]